MPNRTGIPAAKSTPLDCSSKIRSMVFWRQQNRTPSTCPPLDTSELILATERAFPYPFAAGISA